MCLVFFSLFVDFLWSERVVNGLFVVCLDLEMLSVACNLCVWWLMEDKDGIQGLMLMKLSKFLLLCF
jgi:hypothetical protein